MIQPITSPEKRLAKAKADKFAIRMRRTQAGILHAEKKRLELLKQINQKEQS